VVAGYFKFENRTAGRLLAALPPVIHITSEQAQSLPWLEGSLRFLSSEAKSSQPGAEIVMARLSDVLFIQILRAFIAQEEREGRTCEKRAGMLRALVDPDISKALAYMHQQPAHPWTVAELAREWSSRGPTFPELVEALPDVEIIDRSSVNAFDDERVAGAIAATSRKKLIFAGISLEVCAAFPAITAIGKGLGAYVAVDASGTFSETKRQAGLLRRLQAGVIVSEYATLMVEILKDNARPEAGAVYGAMDMSWAKLVGQVAQAYGK